MIATSDFEVPMNGFWSAEKFNGMKVEDGGVRHLRNHIFSHLTA